MLYLIEAMGDTGINEERDVVIVFLVAKAIPFQCISDASYQSGVSRLGFVK